MTRVGRSGSRLLAAALTLLVPGLGHAWAGRRRDGTAFLVLVGSAFAIGLALGGALGTFPGRGVGGFLTTAATHAVVGPALAARALGAGSGTPESPSFEVATTYLVVAGVLNVLLALDAWDIAGKERP